MTVSPPTPQEDASAAAMSQIVAEESRVLQRVERTLDGARQRRDRHPRGGSDYDEQLLSLRDQIRDARLEDVPPLIEEMTRLQHLATRRSQAVQANIDAASPYFGRMVLQEAGKKREVLVGRGTFVDSLTGIRIVDWRDAPVSRVYYRYDEGDDYEESFGGREVRGHVLARRTLGIAAGELRRIGSPQGVYWRDPHGSWRTIEANSSRLRGGQSTALRPESHHRIDAQRIGRLGGDAPTELREDKHLAEITALIDARQFDLISRPTSGLVVIQGGAGSGKTTIGLHRIAYLAYQDPQRFRSNKVLIVVFNDALARYISHVLPALGIGDLPVLTYQSWSHRLRVTHVRGMPAEITEDTPQCVVRFKKHVAMLRMIDVFAAELQQSRLQPRGGSRRDLGEFDIVEAWAEMLTDRQRVTKALDAWAGSDFNNDERQELHRWCASRCTQVLNWMEERKEARASAEARQDADDDDAMTGADGRREDEPPGLDLEDDSILLRLWQTLRGPLRQAGAPLRYEHIFVDETQDLSPVELAVVIDTASEARSVTLAGDVAQRMVMDNSFVDWRTVLDELGLAHVQVEPLRLSYRSTQEIVNLAHHVLGPLAPAEAPQAVRHGAPVELFRFMHHGEAVAFLAEALRDLMRREPKASVALVARYPEQADLYYNGLVTGEVPYLRRIAEQDFPFRPGVDVTDVRQVKGLEFDYVVLLDLSNASFPDDEESRHLLHIATTRAVYQLWLTSVGEPSSLLPVELRASASL